MHLAIVQIPIFAFSVSGAYLIADISIEPPTGYQVSTQADFSSNNGTNGSPLTLSPSSGTVASTTIYVRVVSGASNGVSGDIACTSTSATTQNVATGSATVTTAPNAGTLSGTEAVCSNGSTTFNTDGDGGGTWSSASTGVATINSSTGAISPVAAGTSV